jgi:hypothetical protein
VVGTCIVVDRGELRTVTRKSTRAYGSSSTEFSLGTLSGLVVTRTTSAHEHVRARTPDLLERGNRAAGDQAVERRSFAHQGAPTAALSVTVTFHPTGASAVTKTATVKL